MSKTFSSYKLFFLIACLLSILPLYGQESKKEKPVLVTVVLALFCSCLFSWLPQLKGVSAGISIVICTVAAAAVCAWLFPIPDEEVEA